MNISDDGKELFACFRQRAYDHFAQVGSLEVNTGNSIRRLEDSQELSNSPDSDKKSIPKVDSVVNKTAILFLAADPTDASRLRLGQEYREIQETIQSALLRDNFKLEQRMSVRSADISKAILDVRLSRHCEAARGPR